MAAAVAVEKEAAEARARLRPEVAVRVRAAGAGRRSLTTQAQKRSTPPAHEGDGESVRGAVAGAQQAQAVPASGAASAEVAGARIGVSRDSPTARAAKRLRTDVAQLRVEHKEAEMQAGGEEEK